MDFLLCFELFDGFFKYLENDDETTENDDNIKYIQNTPFPIR